MAHIRWFKDTRLTDIATVGGKNASLGEMYGELAAVGVKVPNGFATLAASYDDFIKTHGIDQLINQELNTLDVEDVQALSQAGTRIREAILQKPFTDTFIAEVTEAYLVLSPKANAAVAVRSSATAEDLPHASFAGQQETFLNVVGVEALLNNIKAVYASLYTDRAIAYRVHHGFKHQDVKISVGIQQMIRSDKGSSGVMFSVDTESGFSDVVLITSSFGLGELVVQGTVNPDEFYVSKHGLRAHKCAVVSKKLGMKDKAMVYDEVGVKTITLPEDKMHQFSLNDAEVTELGHMALKIEAHYQKPMDIEWAKDGVDGELYIVQARPETVVSRRTNTLLKYTIESKGAILVTGRAIGQKIGVGQARIISSTKDMHQLKAGEILVTDMTDPDWEPVMKRSGGIITNRGGRTCHAAIIARELGIPAVVGCIDATSNIQDGQTVSVSCAEGDTGYVYEGQMTFQKHEKMVSDVDDLPLKVMLNLGNPSKAFHHAQLPNDGVGLARLEFIISNHIGIHPLAVLNESDLSRDEKKQIASKIRGYSSAKDFYIEKLVESVATIACAFYPKPVIVRLSDFKSNEYANLLGGHYYEPKEENPMIGYRGASRYVSHTFKEAFELECIALKRVREAYGYDNIELMVPFVRTPNEAKQVINVLKEFGLERGKNGLKLIMMCEVPSNAIIPEAFLEYFDGYSIGSNDLTQLTLGLDRDSELVADQFDERHAAVKQLISKVIGVCKAQNKYIGICGQGPSDYLDFAKWLVSEGIESMSLNPDTVIETRLALQKLAVNA